MPETRTPQTPYCERCGMDRYTIVEEILPGLIWHLKCPVCGHDAAGSDFGERDDTSA